MRRTILFATSNIHKLREATEILSKFRLRVSGASLKPVELQADDIRKIALTACESIMKKTTRPFLVEDSGLFIKGLNGFPGAYSSFVYRTIGVEGVLRLMENRQARKAEFRSALAFCDGLTKTRVFIGESRGKISPNTRGDEGFGFDPIFVPDGFRRTFAEMSLSEKSRVSHRAKAFQAFARWFARHE